MEVLSRSEELYIPPYGRFINPRLLPVTTVTNGEGVITDIKIEYPEDFTLQVLEYSEKHSFLSKRTDN